MSRAMGRMVWKMNKKFVSIRSAACHPTVVSFLQIFALSRYRLIFCFIMMLALHLSDGKESSSLNQSIRSSAAPSSSLNPIFFTTQPNATSDHSSISVSSSTNVYANSTSLSNVTSSTSPIAFDCHLCVHYDICRPDIKKCICFPGWTGRYCDTEFDCSICSNHTLKCMDYCFCKTGWTGERCDQEVIVQSVYRSAGQNDEIRLKNSACETFSHPTDCIWDGDCGCMTLICISFNAELVRRENPDGSTYDACLCNGSRGSHSIFDLADKRCKRFFIRENQCTDGALIPFDVNIKPLQAKPRWYGGKLIHFVNIYDQTTDSAKEAKFFQDFNCHREMCECDKISVQMQTFDGWVPIQIFNFSVHFTTDYNDGFHIQMYSSNDFVCTLEGSLVRIIFPLFCVGIHWVPKPHCEYHVGIKGIQNFDGDLKRNCTAEIHVDSNAMKPEFIAIIALSSILIILLTTIVYRRRILKKCLNGNHDPHGLVPVFEWKEMAG